MTAGDGRQAWVAAPYFHSTVWLIYVLIGLVLVVATGLYVRRRITQALQQFGVRPRRVRVTRWVIAWLLYGFPLVMIVSIAVSLASGSPTLRRFDGLATSYLLVVPFVWSVLVLVQSLVWLAPLEVAYAIVRRWHGDPSARRMRAVAVVAIVGSFAIYTPIRVLVERGTLRDRHHVVGPATSGLPPFRIAFVADVQQDVHTDATRAREVYATINAKQPDIVLSGGDWINAGPEHIESAAEAAATLQSRLGTFSVRGDHEHFAYFDRTRSVNEVEAALRRRGVAMLDNEVRWFEHHGKRIGVVFLNYNYIARADPATTEALIAQVSDADYSILVTHQLDAKLATLFENKVDLVLGAHTHGGQLNPVIGVVHVSLARIETDLIDGRYQRGSTTVIVTAGIGTSVVPIRYAAPGSIELVELRL